METIIKHLKPINLIEIPTSKTNPRSDFNEQSTMESAESIKKNRLLKPLLLRTIAEVYELVCG